MPHLRKPDKTYFVTFCTRDRYKMPSQARDIVLACCIREHTMTCWLDCAVVMPDHVHLILQTFETVSLTKLIGEVKGRSSFLINRHLKRVGPFWQRESFDHIVRREENLEKKIAYVCDNPVRAGLVTDCDGYQWLWRSWRKTAG